MGSFEMSGVLELYNAYGILQLSSDFIGYFCRKTGTGTTVSTSYGNTAISQMTVDITGFTSPIIAVQVPGYAAAYGQFSGNTMILISNAPVGTAFTYFVFDQSSAIPESTGPGLKTWDTDGNLTFDSQFRPMLLLAQLSNTTTFLTDGDSYTGATGSELASACLTYAAVNKPGNDYTCYVSGTGEAWEGGACPELHYNNVGKLCGGRVSADLLTVTATGVSYDDVDVTYGSVPPGTEQSDIDDEESWECRAPVYVVDVTTIPIGETFF